LKREFGSKWQNLWHVKLSCKWHFPRRGDQQIGKTLKLSETAQSWKSCIVDVTRKAAEAAYDQFIASYEAKYFKAVDCLQKDKERLFTFYDFPAKHWSHLRTTTRSNQPLRQSDFAPKELRGCDSSIATLTMLLV
jgi:transposase-like protein